MNALKQNDNNQPDTGLITREPYNSEVFSAFVSWSALTKKERKDAGVPTAKAFAIRHGIQESQLSRWKDREDFYRLKADHLREKMREQTPEVLEGLQRRCKRYGMAHDVELWLALVEGWDRKRSLVIQQESFGLDDIRSILAYLPKNEQDHYYVIIGEMVTKAEQYQRKSLS